MALFDHYPREIDMRTRKVIHNKKQLEHYLKSTNGKANLTTTVYGFRELKTKGNRCEYSTAIVPHFVMDFDADQAVRLEKMTLNDAQKKCCSEVELMSRVLKRQNIQHAIWFTGGGFHIWVKLDQTYDLQPIEMNDLLFSGRMQINKWVKIFNLITLDPVVSFRPDRHIRIPNTYNFKRQLWGIPVNVVDLEKGWAYIEEQAQEARPGMKMVSGGGMMITIVKRDSQVLFESKYDPASKSFKMEDIDIEIDNINNIPMLPCLSQAACEVGSNPPHKPRSYLMMYLMDFNRNFARPPRESKISNQEVIAKTHEFIKSLKWADYNQNETMKYLIHGADRYYKTPTCPTIYAEGMCVGRCPYYDGKGSK